MNLNATTTTDAAFRAATWTAERVDRLRSGITAGLSCSQIAAEIGVTRNAVIGKIHRLGLGPGRKPAAIAQRMRAAPAQARGRLARIARILRAANTGPTLVPNLTPIETQASERAPRCSLLDLGNDHCHWPLGDPTKADFGFCGREAIAGLSYCAGHARLAYRLPSGRRA